MTRVFKGFGLFSLGLVVAFAVSAWRRPAKADITTELATRIIDVEFDDWVLVYTNSLLQTSNPDYNVMVTKEIKAGGVRFHVVGSYANDAGRTPLVSSDWTEDSRAARDDLPPVEGLWLQDQCRRLRDRDPQSRSEF